MTIRPGDEWGTPTTEPPDLTVRGGDAALADAIGRQSAGALIDFVADHTSDLARALGTSGDAARRGIAAPIDAIALTHAGNRRIAVNAIEVGTPPAELRALSRERAITVTVDGRRIHRGPATGVVIANGQFIDGLDVVPRGHPGDGRLEVQVHWLRPGERGAMRRRLATGSHLPHPRIRTASGRRVRVHVEGGVWPLRVDGAPSGRAGTVECEVVSPAARLLL